MHQEEVAHLFLGIDQLVDQVKEDDVLGVEFHALGMVRADGPQPLYNHPGHIGDDKRATTRAIPGGLLLVAGQSHGGYQRDQASYQRPAQIRNVISPPRPRWVDVKGE